MRRWSLNTAGIGTGIEAKPILGGQSVYFTDDAGQRQECEHWGLRDEDLLDVFSQCRKELKRRGIKVKKK